MRNTGTQTNTWTLSLGALPAGVTGSLTQTSVTLTPGQYTNVSTVLANITPSTGTAFQFTVTASINGVANSSRTIDGTLTARSQFLQVQDVTAAPGFRIPAVRST